MPAVDLPMRALSHRFFPLCRAGFGALGLLAVALPTLVIPATAAQAADDAPAVARPAAASATARATILRPYRLLVPATPDRADARANRAATAPAAPPPPVLERPCRPADRSGAPAATACVERIVDLP